MRIGSLPVYRQQSHERFGRGTPQCALPLRLGALTGEEGLRKEEPGKVYQAGDLDNRLKTLFDALAVPKDEQVVSDQTIVDPIYCLLEDDALIANCTIETHRLLSRPLASKYAVILLIEVDVRVIQPRQYNQPFLGD